MKTSGTLAGQLSVRVTLIVAVLAAFLSLATILAASSIFLGQLDDQLDQAQSLQRGGPLGKPDRAPGIDVLGLEEGTIIVAVLPDGSVRGSTIGKGAVQALTVDSVNALLAVPADGQKRTVQVPGMGRYRVEASEVANIQVVVALPMAHLQKNLRGLTLLSVGLGVISVVVAAVATRAVSGRLTRPLRNLGRAASEVSQLSLDVGEVEAVTRVEPTNLPPTHEVSQLTSAFNHMLTNVEGALTARQASETKLRRFVADASHELRNPLASIRGYAELAERAISRGGDQDDVTFSLERISSESARMSKLVSDLFLLARLDADAPTQLVPVDVVEVVLNAVSDTRVAGKDHTWRLELPDAPVVVSADPDQLHQVVVNLLSNARSHTPPGTTVTTGVVAAGGWAQITVTDNGPGIAPEVLPHVFERFARADEARTHNNERSTGLGLAIVQAVVQRFGGAVTAESWPGRTTFTVRLPRQAAPAG